MKVARFHFSGLSILKSLPPKEVQWIAKHSKTRKFGAYHELFREGAYPKHVYILKRGKVKIYQTTAEGNEQIVYIYEPGDMFGYRPLLCNEKHPVTARTLEESTVVQISRTNFLELLHQSHVLAKLLLKNLSSEFSVWINYITTFAQYSVKERLALSLLILSEKYKSPANKQGTIILPRKDLASFVGTSIETLARLLTQWKNAKYIVVKGRQITIKDHGQLAHWID